MRIFNKIKEVRLQKNLTQAELADLLNSSQPQIYKLENGQRKLTVEWLIRISRALNCKAEDLVDLK